MSSTMSTSKKIVIKPIIITNTKKMVINSKSSGMLLSKIKFANKMYKEDVIYESSNCDFLKGDSQKVRIVNKVNLMNKSYRTIAICTSKGVSVETTSDDICKLIGQNNYDTILSALGSVFNEETKVRGILALLKKQTTYTSISTEMDVDTSNKCIADKGVQVSEYDINLCLKKKQRKRIRRQQFAPYIVKETPAKVKKCVISVENVVKNKQIEEEKPLIVDIKPDLTEKLAPTEDKKPDLLDLKSVIDEDSNMSCGNISNLSWPSVSSIPGLLENPDSLLDLPITKDMNKAITQCNADRPVNSSYIMLRNGTNIFVPVKPEDMFHIATPEILKNVTTEESKLLICEQANYDLKMCLEQDEDGYYPLHVAVLNDDADLVMRQCRALRARREPVDLVAGGLTALHMAIRKTAAPPLCTKLLLQYGADPLLCDAERRTALHLCAADAELHQLRCVLEHCDTYARQVLKNNGDFWKPELESETDKRLTIYLYERVSEMFDEQGYNPLMRACDGGLPAHAALLVARAPSLVDAPAPGCGSTALYRAVAAACLHAKETGNRSTASENFLKTIEILVENGADPSVENHSGSSVNTLLTEFNICALSMTIANKMTSMKHGKLANNMILYKEKDGRIGYKNLHGLKEIHERDRNIDKKQSDGKARKTVPLKAVITFDVKNEAIPPKKYMSAKEAKGIHENFSNASKEKSDNINSNVTKDKPGLKIIKVEQNIPDKDKRTDKVVIVENVKFENTVFPAAMASGSSVVKPKDFVLTTPRSLLNIHRDKVDNMARATGFIKIAPKITPKMAQPLLSSKLFVKKVQVAGTTNAKKRKLDNKMK